VFKCWQQLCTSVFKCTQSLFSSSNPGGKGRQLGARVCGWSKESAARSWNQAKLWNLRAGRQPAAR
jgi:hypothetical protein